MSTIFRTYEFFFIIWFDLPFSMLRSSLIINKKRTFKVQEWSLNWWQVFSLEFRRFSQNAFSYRTSLDGYFWRPLMKFKVVKLPSIYIYIRLQLNFYRCPEFLPIFLDQFCEYFKKSLSTDVWSLLNKYLSGFVCCWLFLETSFSEKMIIQQIL